MPVTVEGRRVRTRALGDFGRCRKNRIVAINSGPSLISLIDLEDVRVHITAPFEYV